MPDLTQGSRDNQRDYGFTQLPQAQYCPFCNSRRVYTNKHDNYDLKTGKNVNICIILYYKVSLITISISQHIIVIVLL